MPNPLDPAWAWLHAADLAAHLAEAARWDWDDPFPAAARVAGRLAEAVYRDEPAAQIESLVRYMDDLLDRLNGPSLWLASLKSREVDANELVEAARSAFRRLRYSLFEDGCGRAA